MFTGIVAAVGRIASVTPLGEGTDDAAGLRLTVDAGALDLSDVAIGDSISMQGAYRARACRRRQGWIVQDR